MVNNNNNKMEVVPANSNNNKRNIKRMFLNKINKEMVIQEIKDHKKKK
jgi:hypothetical protein